MKLLSPFVDIFLHHLVEWIDPWLAIVIGQSRCSPKSILHLSYTATIMNGYCGANLLINPAYDKLFVTKTYLTIALICWQLKDEK